MREGKEKLWRWFGLTRSSFLIMPRVLMHEMPDEWQRKMSQLLEEWDDSWDTDHLPSPSASARDENNRYTRWPDWLLNYRRPCATRIEVCRRKRKGGVMKPLK